MPIERPFSESDWLATPEPVRRYVESLAQRIEQLESRLNQDSQNSNKPPSSDPPYQRPALESRKSKRRRGGQKGHKGHRQQMLKPTEVMSIEPSPCACGCTRRRAIAAILLYASMDRAARDSNAGQALGAQKGPVLKLWPLAESAAAERVSNGLWPPVQLAGGRAQRHPGDQPAGRGGVHPERFRCSHFNRRDPESDRPGLRGAITRA